MDDTGQTRESVEQARASLQAESDQIVRASKRINENLVEAVHRIWRQLLIIWMVVVFLALSYLLVVSYVPRTAKAPPGVLPESASLPEASPTLLNPSDTFPPIPERDELVRLLNQIREAQYKKDIQMFMSAYAPGLPDLAKKRELTLNIWRRYDYLDMHFHVSDLQAGKSSSVQGKITWDIKARDRKDNAGRSFVKTYQVQFSKETGQWLIQKLEAVSGTEPGN